MTHTIFGAVEGDEDQGIVNAMGKAITLSV